MLKQIALGMVLLASLLAGTAWADEALNRALFDAAYAGDKAKVEALIVKGADINAKEKDGRTSLYEAVSEGKKETAELLLAKGADINAKGGYYGNTPLHEAVSKGKKDKPEAVFRDCNDCPEMVVLPAGSTGQAFAMGKYEVTQGQWRAVMGNNPSGFKNCGDDCPVELVGWNDAKEFIHRLNSKTGKQYRLPTDAEWEYSCRAGGQQEYCGSDNADSVAWYDKNSGDTTHPAGRKQPNAFGLYDMSGNVWEWVEDCYNGDCGRRVLRSGSWDNSTLNLRATNRVNDDPGYRYVDIGFRVARTLP